MRNKKCNNIHLLAQESRRVTGIQTGSAHITVTPLL